MNRLELVNQFKRGLGDLLRSVERELERPRRDPFAEIDPNRLPHEHDTRLIFIDELLRHLGWQVGAQGNVLEEARLQANTTTFMDYLGVAGIDDAPLLLVEAKAWGKPAISARGEGQHLSQAEVVVAAIQHIRNGEAEGTSPVIPEWHRYLIQVRGYVVTLKEQYGHDLPRAVVISGEWLVVFTAPVETFLRFPRSDHIAIFTRSEFEDRARDIFGLLHRTVLTEDVPMPLRPAQLPQFIDFDGVAGTFKGIHIRYERTGSSLFGHRPRILVYPALFVAREDNAVFTVIADRNPVELNYYKDENDVETLAPHVESIEARSGSLVAECGAELGGALPIAELSEFPGFLSDGMSKAFVGPLRQADEWLIATGSATHFLLAEPRIRRCRFHCWAQCGDHAAQQSAINTPSVEPAAFFVDTQRHHCAHQVILDRRAERCLIQAIDSRTCCQACVYLEHCWTADELAALPCGQ